MNQDVSEGEFRVEQFLSKANKVKKKSLSISCQGQDGK